MTLIGRLTDEPIVRYRGHKLVVVGFGVAVKNNDGTETLHSVVSVKREAEVIASYMKKDRLVEVQGIPYTYTWTDAEGKERRSIAVAAEHVQFVSPRRAAELREGERTARAVHHASGPAAAVHDRHRKGGDHGISR